MFIKCLQLFTSNSLYSRHVVISQWIIYVACQLELDAHYLIKARNN